MSRRRRAALLLGLALLLGTLAATTVARRESALEAQIGPLVDVVVARTDLPAGRHLREAILHSAASPPATPRSGRPRVRPR